MTDTVELLEKAGKAVLPWTTGANTPEPNRLDVHIEPSSLKPAVIALMKAHWGYFAALTGIDQPPSGEGESVLEGRVELLYHFCNGAAIFTLRMSVPYSDAKIDSICDILPSATLYERELIEMLGVECVNTPSTDKLLLADDWPDGVYPLRKSFTGFAKLDEEAHDGSPA